MMSLSSYLFFIPGALESTLTLLCFCALWIRRRQLSSAMIPRSLAAAFGLRLAIQIGFDIYRDSWAPLLILVLALLTTLFFFFARSEGKYAHWGAVLAGLIIYVGSFQLMTFEIKTKTEPVLWEIEEATPEALVHFQFENFPNHGFVIASNAIANHLRGVVDKKISAQIEGTYHWGALDNYNPVRIDGFPVPVGTESSMSCGDDCSRPPFSTYDLRF